MSQPYNRIKCIFAKKYYYEEAVPDFYYCFDAVIL